MSDECVNPGTMCASVISDGTHGISRLHVCVELIIFPFGSVICSGNSAFFMFTVGDPSTRKCAVAPESDIACTMLLIRWLFNNKLAFGRSRIFSFTISCLHASALMRMLCAVGMECPLSVLETLQARFLIALAGGRPMVLCI